MMAGKGLSFFKKYSRQNDSYTCKNENTGFGRGDIVL